LGELPEAASFALAAAALLRSQGPRGAGNIATKLRFSCAESDAVVWLLTHLPRVVGCAGLELADVKLLLANPRFGDLTALLRAELVVEGASLEAHGLLMNRAGRIDPAHVAPPALVSGDDLLSMDAVPGPRFGEILEEVYRAQLNEEIHDREAALQLARELVSRGE
jgi:hypothetical protein